MQTETPLYYHGTKAVLNTGDLLLPGYRSNYGQGKMAKFIYFSATLDAATWGAELAQGEASGRIYLVEPTGSFEDDPNVTDKKFAGNPTKSYRTLQPLRVTGEILDWEPHPEGQVVAMRARIEEMRQQGIEAIED